jgi:hypothetical protein
MPAPAGFVVTVPLAKKVYVIVPVAGCRSLAGIHAQLVRGTLQVTAVMVTLPPEGKGVAEEQPGKITRE